MSRLDELKTRLVETIKTKINTQIQMILDERTEEIDYTVLTVEIKDAIDALDSAVLKDDDQIRAVFSQSTSTSIYNAIYKYFNGVEPDYQNAAGILPPTPTPETQKPMNP